MSTPSTGSCQPDCLPEVNAIAQSTTTKLQTHRSQNSTTIMNRSQSIRSGIQINQHQIVQKIPNAIQPALKISSQQFDKASASNVISYRLTQKNSMSAGHATQRINVFQRSGNNEKLMNGYGSSQIHEANITNDSGKIFNCHPVQEMSIPLQFRISPNVIPGWLRQIAEGVIVYVR